MIKGSSFASKYINVITDKIISWSTTNRGTIFIRGADIESMNFQIGPESYSKTNSIQKRRANCTDQGPVNVTWLK